MDSIGYIIWSNTAPDNESVALLNLKLSPKRKIIESQINYKTDSKTKSETENDSET